MDVRRRAAQAPFSSMKLLREFLQAIEVGGRRPLLVRRETVAHIGVSKHILFASDLHLRKDGPRRIVDGLVQIALEEHPDLVLLGGDLVDWSSGLEALQSLVRRLSRVAPVGAVAGNHDRWIGVASVRAAVLAGPLHSRAARRTHSGPRPALGRGRLPPQGRNALVAGR